MPSPEDRKRAVELVRFIAGPVEEMGPKTQQMLESFHRIRGLPQPALPAPTKDPLRTSITAAPHDLLQVLTDAAPAVEAPKPRDAFGAIKPKGKVKTKKPHSIHDPGNVA